MKIKKKIVLIGMMGSGKSTIGCLTAKKLKKKFIDTDKIIEKETNLTILEIFKQKGEFFFRSLEENVILKILNSSDNIISIGGGAFLNEKIRKEILKQDISIWLKWKNQILLKRIKNSKKRPIILDLNENEILNIINHRSKIYSKSKFKINCNGLTKDKIANKIIKIYENH